MPNKTEPRRYEIGETVMARWPRSNLFFKGEVLDYNDVEYLIRFDEDERSELAIKYKDVQPPFMKRSRSRSRGRASSPVKRSPSKKSPSRKSPARKSPSRKSPSRKSPSRKSPAKSQKSPSRRSPSTRSPARNATVKAPKEEQKSDSIYTSVSSRSSLKHTVEKTEEKAPPKKDVSPAVRNRVQAPAVTAATTTTFSSSRHSARIAALDLKKQTELDGKSNNSSSVTSNSIKVDTTSVVKSLEKRNKVLDLLKRLLLCIWMTVKSLPSVAIVFAFPYILSLLCTANKCEIHWPTLPKKMPSILERKFLAMAGGYLLCLLFLAFFPVGKKVESKSGAKIRCNAYVSLVAVGVAVGVLLKMDVSLATVYLFYRHFLLLFSALGVVTAVLLYLKSFLKRWRGTMNPQGTTGYYITDFIEGREVTPRVGNFDVKFFLMRMAIISSVFLNVLIVAKDLQGKPGLYSPTLLVSAGMQVFYTLDFLLFEDSFLTMYEYTTKGFGLTSCIEYFHMPFVVTFYSKFVLNHGIELQWYYLVGIVALNLLGYTILRGANSQKHAFRTNPADPALVHLESLPTSTRNRLIVSGWWGFVRHPNYMGDLLVQLSWVLPCGVKNIIPWSVFAFSLLYLLARTFIVEKRCREKYGLAWSSYTTRVPHRLIPKVF